MWNAVRISADTHATRRRFRPHQHHHAAFRIASFSSGAQLHAETQIGVVEPRIEAGRHEGLFDPGRGRRGGRRVTDENIVHGWAPRGVYPGAMTEPRPHLSMLRSYTAADVLTIGNASCGTIALFLCLDYVETGSNRFIWFAFLLLPMALVFDILDGWVARRSRHRKSVLGGDLDSLADVISFGVAPAVLGFTLGHARRLGHAVPHLLRGVRRQPSRAIQRHVGRAHRQQTGKVKYFEGTPIPTSIAIVALLAAALEFGHTGSALWFGAWRIGPATLHPLALVYVLSGSAMISATLRSEAVT
jgi:CDP-diacylglycerol--serine O-phosphatidyltransferase